MRKRSSSSRRRRRKRKKKRIDDASTPETADVNSAKQADTKRPNAFYNARPAFGLAPEQDQEAAPDQAQQAEAHEEEMEAGTEVEAAPDLRGQGEPEEMSVYGKNLRLEGKTKARFDGGRYHVDNLNVSKAEGCGGCKVRHCIHATGTLVATYSVTTSVTLPSTSKHPKLTPCQKKRVQDAITNILAPHEQQHVTAFETYNGTTKRPFDLTVCRSKLRGRIKAMFTAEERSRRSAAKTASAALDPFFVEIDLNCKDASAATGAGGMSGPKMAGRAAEPADGQTAEMEGQEVEIA